MDVTHSTLKKTHYGPNFLFLTVWAKTTITFCRNWLNVGDMSSNVMSFSSRHAMLLPSRRHDWRHVADTTHHVCKWRPGKTRQNMTFPAKLQSKGKLKVWIQKSNHRWTGWTQINTSGRSCDNNVTLSYHSSSASIWGKPPIPALPSREKPSIAPHGSVTSPSLPTLTTAKPPLLTSSQSRRHLLW